MFVYIPLSICLDSVYIHRNTANVKRQVDLMGISTFVKYGSETILGIHNKTARTLARNAGDYSSSQFTLNAYYVLL